MAINSGFSPRGKVYALSVNNANTAGPSTPLTSGDANNDAILVTNGGTVVVHGRYTPNPASSGATPDAAVVPVAGTPQANQFVIPGGTSRVFRIPAGSLLAFIGEAAGPTNIYFQYGEGML